MVRKLSRSKKSNTNRIKTKIDAEMGFNHLFKKTDRALHLLEKRRQSPVFDLVDWLKSKF